MIGIKNISTLTALLGWTMIMNSCMQGNGKAEQLTVSADKVLQPELITDSLPNDTDDPAIWIDSSNIANSLIIGTDKDENGGLYVFDMNGHIDRSRSVTGLKRPNNVDIEYGLLLNGERKAIAVTTERQTSMLRIYGLPEMKAIDNGGIPVFENEKEPGFRDLMGIGLYRNPAGKIYAIVGRKTGPTDGSYLWQYLLEDDGTGHVKASLVRKFGRYSGTKEIEAIAVDDRMGYVYYSDERVGVRKYYADPEKGNEELALFADSGFSEDNEGISIYTTSDSTGFILVSDQSAHEFQIFNREGTASNPHEHKLLRKVKVAATNSDGSEIVSLPMGDKFPMGLFVVMSDNKTFHYYRAEQVIGDSLLQK